MSNVRARYPLNSRTCSRWGAKVDIYTHTITISTLYFTKLTISNYSIFLLSLCKKKKKIKKLFCSIKMLSMRPIHRHMTFKIFIFFNMLENFLYKSFFLSRGNYLTIKGYILKSLLFLLLKSKHRRLTLKIFKKIIPCTLQ